MRQPYAHALARLGADVLTRPYGTDRRGLVAIYAPSTWSERGSHDGRVLAAHAAVTGQYLEALDGRHLPTHGFVAVAELVDVHRPGRRDTCCQPWGERLVYDLDESVGRYRAHHWQLADITPIPFIPSAGRPGPTWALDRDQRTAITRALETTR